LAPAMPQSRNLGPAQRFPTSPAACATLNGREALCASLESFVPAGTAASLHPTLSKGLHLHSPGANRLSRKQRRAALMDGLIRTRFQLLMVLSAISTRSQTGGLSPPHLAFTHVEAAEFSQSCRHGRRFLKTRASERCSVHAVSLVRAEGRVWPPESVAKRLPDAWT